MLSLAERGSQGQGTEVLRACKPASHQLAQQGLRHRGSCEHSWRPSFSTDVAFLHAVLLLLCAWHDLLPLCRSTAEESLPNTKSVLRPSGSCLRMKNRKKTCAHSKNLHTRTLSMTSVPKAGTWQIAQGPGSLGEFHMHIFPAGAILSKGDTI